MVIVMLMKMKMKMLMVMAARLISQNQRTICKGCVGKPFEAKIKERRCERCANTAVIACLNDFGFLKLCLHFVIAVSLIVAYQPARLW